MSLILLIAAIAHFKNPDTFIALMPDFIPYKSELVFITGILEILFVPGLWIDSTRKLFAYMLAGYFLLLLPVHLHMALENIPLGSLQHPAWLWGRVGLQFVLMYWAYRLGLKTIDNRNEIVHG